VNLNEEKNENNNDNNEDEEKSLDLPAIEGDSD
jgi:hypothetical protein